MIPELGLAALCIALALALLQAISGLLGGRDPAAAWRAVARRCTWLQAGLGVMAMAALALSFARQDYSVAYVAEHASSALPLVYRLGAVWGGHEGSMLLWLTLLGCWSSVFALTMPKNALCSAALGVLAILSLGFLAYIIGVSNPFSRLFPAPPDGNDLNPLLQDPGLIFHPPVLYMGYVGLSVPFALALGSLLTTSRQDGADVAWARLARPWNLMAWLWLGAGIAAGSDWAYYELGWGGWWFWDPVENASLMPWLVATALLHSLVVTQQRQLFGNWSVLLAIAGLALSLLGTFLVRSGVLTSVHAFAADPSRGIFILGLIGVMVGGALVIHAWRGQTLARGAPFALLSRETMLLINNVLLLAACGAVFLGTLYPLLMDVMHWGKISVGRPYFNTVFVPLLWPVLVLSGMAAWRPWRSVQLHTWLRRARLPVLVAVVPTALALVLGMPALPFAAGLAAACFTLTSSFWSLLQTLRQGLLPGLTFYGMHLAHMGLACFAIGAAVSGSFETTEDVVLHPGQSMTLAGYTVRLRDVSEHATSGYRALRATVVFERHGHAIVLEPEKRRYASGMVTTEAAIHWGVLRDLFVALGDTLGEDGYSLHLAHKPLIRCIWAGAGLMIAGGALGFLGQRRARIPLARRTQAKVAA
jgi:cytochrome c-type biogenesis protein CcmF